MIELYQLEQLVIIADAGTISKAAEKLLISQPGLTRSMYKYSSNISIHI